jgi:hypothetical protein
MPANRMSRDQFYTAMAPNDDTCLRKVLWTLYWRGNARLRERIEDELRSPDQPEVKPKKELPDPGTVLDVARLLSTPDMWRTFAESYLDALDAAGRADPGRPHTVYGSSDQTRYRRYERAKDLAAWHEMLLDRFAGTPEDELLDRLAVSPALAGPELTFLRARIAERRGDVTQAATLVTECLKELPGHQGYLDFAVEVGAELPPRARELLSERARILSDAP